MYKYRFYIQYKLWVLISPLNSVHTQGFLLRLLSFFHGIRAKFYLVKYPDTMAASYPKNVVHTLAKSSLSPNSQPAAIRSISLSTNSHTLHVTQHRLNGRNLWMVSICYIGNKRQRQIWLSIRSYFNSIKGYNKLSKMGGREFDNNGSAYQLNGAKDR